MWTRLLLRPPSRRAERRQSIQRRSKATIPRSRPILCSAARSRASRPPPGSLTRAPFYQSTNRAPSTHAPLPLPPLPSTPPLESILASARSLSLAARSHCESPGMPPSADKRTVSARLSLAFDLSRRRWEQIHPPTSCDPRRGLVGGEMSPYGGGVDDTPACWPDERSGHTLTAAPTKMGPLLCCLAAPNRMATSL